MASPKAIPSLLVLIGLGLMLATASSARIQLEPSRKGQSPVEGMGDSVRARDAHEEHEEGTNPPASRSRGDRNRHPRDRSFQTRPIHRCPQCPTPFTWTTSEHFDQGVLISVHHDAPDQLQRNELPTPFPYVWVAASSRGTIVRIDTDTGQILGEYRSSPHNHANNPSRTTVGLDGNVWVANRDDTYCETGSITKVGLVIGGTRVDADGTPNENGDYLKQPFEYCNCEDRDGDGLIKTSRGLGHILDWDNTNGADDDGGVDNAEDECVLRHTRVAGTGTRTIAIDANNDVWVGGRDNYVHEKVDGFSGLPVDDTQFNLGCGGYGGLVDGDTVLWSATRVHYLLRKHTTNPMVIPLCIDTEISAYGLGIDGNGDIWLTNFEYDSVTKVGPDGTIIDTFPTGGASDDRGVAITPIDNHVWVANSAGNNVSRLDNAGTALKVISLGANGSTPTGVAVDAGGKVWATCRDSDTVKRIDPLAGADGLGEVDLTVDLDSGAGPYNYSDMTGLVALHTSATGTWVAVHDGEALAAEWHLVTWNTEGCASPHEPPGTSLTVEVRAADKPLGLAFLPYTEVENGVPFFGVTGRYIQIRVRFKGSPLGEAFATPVLCDLTVTWDLQSGEDCQDNDIPDECEPDCNNNGTADECDVPPICTDPWPTCSPDCNGNLIPDECELVGNDCNNNGVPDDCESDDCNGNSLSDLCDIADGTSADCNDNDIPDECEVPPLGAGDDCNENLIPDECELIRYVLYAVTSESPGVYTVDPSTGSCDHVADMDQGIDEARGLSTHPYANELYAIAWVIGGTTTTRLLVTVDKETAVANAIGELSADLADIAFSDDGTLYGIRANSGEIVTIDTNDASIASTGCFGNSSPQHSIAFKPGTSVLYHHAYRVCEEHTVFETIDISTCELAVVGGFCNGSLFPFDCLAFQSNVTPLLGFSSVPGNLGVLYDSPPSTCDLSARGSCGITITGMAFVPTDNDCNGNLIPDDCDIANETSDDCQPNGIPDECEPDCDGDGIPDDCDDGACCYESEPDVWTCVDSQTMQECADLASSGTGEYTWHCTEEICSQLWPPLPDCGNGACCYNDQAFPPGEPATCEDNLDETTCMGRTGFIKWEVNKTCAEISCYVPPLNDDCADKETLPGNGVYGFDTSWATTDGPNPTTCLDEQSQPISMAKDIWYQYVATCDGTLVVDTRGSTFDTMIVVYHDWEYPTQCTCPPDPSVDEWCNDDIVSGQILQSYLIMDVTTDYCYLIRIGGKEDDPVNGGPGQIVVDCIPYEDGRCCYPDDRGEQYLCATTDENDCVIQLEGCWTDTEEVAPGVFLQPISCLTTSCDCCKGDVDGNNVIDGRDIPEFIAALLAPPDCDTRQFCSADVNSDVILDVADIPDFVAALLSGAPCP